MLPSKDEGGWLLRGLALRGLLAQAPQGEGLRAQPLIRLLSPPKGGTFSPHAGRRPKRRPRVPPSPRLPGEGTVRGKVPSLDVKL